MMHNNNSNNNSNSLNKFGGTHYLVDVSALDDLVVINERALRDYIKNDHHKLVSEYSTIRHRYTNYDKLFGANNTEPHPAYKQIVEQFGSEATILSLRHVIRDRIEKLFVKSVEYSMRSKTAANTQLSDTVAKHERQISFLNVKVADLENEVVLLSNQNSSLQTQLSVLSDETTSLRSILSSNSIVVQQNERHLQATKKELDFTKAELTDTKAKLASTKAELASTKAELASTKAELADTKVELHTLYSELENEIKRSEARLRSELRNELQSELSSEFASKYSELERRLTDMDTFEEAVDLKSKVQNAIGQKLLPLHHIVSVTPKQSTAHLVRQRQLREWLGLLSMALGKCKRWVDVSLEEMVVHNTSTVLENTPPTSASPTAPLKGKRGFKVTRYH
jgi:predicted  nucleic acid-binding Zn-ribbon protein